MERNEFYRDPKKFVHIEEIADPTPNAEERLTNPSPVEDDDEDTLFGRDDAQETTEFVDRPIDPPGFETQYDLQIGRAERAAARQERETERKEAVQDEQVAALDTQADQEKINDLDKRYYGK